MYVVNIIVFIVILQRWKLAQILWQLAPESGPSAAFQRWIPARVSGKCVMGIKLFNITV